MENSTINVSGITNGTNLDSVVETTSDEWIINFVKIVRLVTVVFAAISIIMNIFTIFVVVSFNLCYRFSYVLTANLSFSDALLAFSMLTEYLFMFYLRGLHRSFILFSMYCSMYIFNISSVASLLTIILMTLELFSMVKYPLKHIRLFKQMRVRTMRYITAAVWVIAILPACIHITVVLVRQGPFSAEASFFQMYRLTVTIVAIFGFITILFLYIAVLKVLYTRNVGNQRETRSMKKVAITVFLIVCVYFLFYLPYWIPTIIALLDLELDYNLLIFYVLSRSCLAINTACDPIIYAVRIPKIREGFRKIFCCCRNEMF